MYRDDPEKRIADFERQLANASGGADQELHRFPGQSRAPKPRSRRQRPRGGIRRWLGWLVRIVFFGSIAVGGAMALGSAGYNVYAYQVGTPTTATIDHCASRGGGSKSPGYLYCTGTWNINGTSSSGPIVGLEGSPVEGQKAQVRVHDGAAYSADAWNVTSQPVLWFLGVIAIGVGVWFFNRWRRRLGTLPPGERPGF